MKLSRGALWMCFAFIIPMKRGSRVRDAVERKMGWCVDHILATKSLAGRSRSCNIDLASRLRKKPSDHVII